MLSELPDLRGIRAFLILVEELHFGRTAQRLGVTHARVSQQIRTLEAQLGGRLFDRTTRQVRITPLGADLAGRVRQSFTQLLAALEASARRANEDDRDGVNGEPREARGAAQRSATVASIELLEIRAFLTLAHELHFGRTAEWLGVTQSRVSQLIRRLEAEIGARLFDRTSRRVQLTPFGERLLADVAAAYAQLQRVLRDIRRMATRPARTPMLVEQTVRVVLTDLGAVRVGYIYSAVFETLPRLVSAMSESHPEVTVDVRDGWTPELDAALLVDGYDLVLSRDMPVRPEYRRETLRSERLVAVVDEGHPLVGRGRVGLREFAGERFCHPPQRLAPDRFAFMVAALERTGESFGYWESPIHGLSHLDLHDRRSFALVAGSVAGRVPVGTTSIVLTDDLPALDLEMVWRLDNPSAALVTLIDTARTVARNQGWSAAL